VFDRLLVEKTARLNLRIVHLETRALLINRAAKWTRTQTRIVRERDADRINVTRSIVIYTHGYKKRRDGFCDRINPIVREHRAPIRIISSVTKR